MANNKNDSEIRYIDIYAKTLLNEIKNRIKQNNIQLTNKFNDRT